MGDVWRICEGTVGRRRQECHLVGPAAAPRSVTIGGVFPQFHINEGACSAEAIAERLANGTGTGGWRCFILNQGFGIIIGSVYGLMFGLLPNWTEHVEKDAKWSESQTAIARRLIFFQTLNLPVMPLSFLTITSPIGHFTDGPEGVVCVGRSGDHPDRIHHRLRGDAVPDARDQSQVRPAARLRGLALT